MFPFLATLILRGRAKHKLSREPGSGPQLHSKYLSLYPQISGPYPSSKKHSYLEQMKTITENYNQSKCRVVESSPNGYIYKLLYLRLRNTVEEGGERL